MILMFFWKKSFFGRKMGVAATVAPNGLGPRASTKKLAHQVDLLSQPLSRKLVLKKFGSEPPLPALNGFCQLYGINIILIIKFQEVQDTGAVIEKNRGCDLARR